MFRYLFLFVFFVAVGVAAHAGEINPPDFSVEGGFFQEAITLVLSSDRTTGQIYYTTDGSEPDNSSARYENPLEIDTSSIIRAVVIDENQSSRIITHTYLFGRKPGLPVISLVTDHNNLFDPDSGIYVNPHERGIEWERPVNFELFTADGSPGLNQAAGIRIHGGWSRTLPQKTFRIYARNAYSDRTFFYPLTDGGVEEYRRFLIRNSGNDWASTLFRDALMQSLMKGTGIDRQGYRPAVVFLNGEYWGIQNLRARFDRHYLEAAHGVDPDNVDILEYSKGVPDNIIVSEGDNSHFLDMIDFIENHDISDDLHFADLAERIDTDNFTRYQVGQIYFGNYDWPSNNNTIWRERTETGKWRSFLYDTDFGFMLYRDRHDQGVSWENDYTHNTLDYASTQSGPFDYPYQRNPPWSTFVFYNLLKNESFRHNFITLFSDYLNSRFHPDYVSRQIRDMSSVLEPEIPYHAERWGGHAGGGGLTSFQSAEEWKSNVDVLHEFAEKRADHVFEHLQERFDLENPVTLSLDISHSHKGYLQINSLHIRKNETGIPETPYPWQGSYFPGVPVQVIAHSYPGYKLAGWEGTDAGSESDTLHLVLNDESRLKALFVADPSFDENSLFPRPHDFSAGGFYFSTWNTDEPAGAYPDHMAFVYMDNDDPRLNAEIAGYTEGRYNYESRTRINGLGNKGLAFINTGNIEGNPGYPGRRIGGAILALDTRGQDEIYVQWTGGTVIPNSRIYYIRLQYRTGSEGEFLNLYDENGNLVEYRRREQSGHSQDIGPVALPPDALNKPYVQLLWRYYFTGKRLDEESGQRSKLRVGDIRVMDASEMMIPRLIGPIQNARVLADDLTMKWSNIQVADDYRVQLSDSPDFSSVLLDLYPVYETALPIANLEPGIYHWRIKAKNSQREGQWSDIESFIVSSWDPHGIPDQITLLPNYPNPFNPFTTIVFGLPEPGHVNLDVYTVTGRHVTTLADGMRNEGYHEVTLDGRNLASGVYFYRLQSGSVQKTGTMMLIK